MPNSFENRKALRIVITLAMGKFGSSSANQITLEGYRASVDVELAGANQQGALNARIYGVSQSDMNSATTLAWQFKKGDALNTIQVFAVDGAQETGIFAGDIVNAWAVYENQPEVFLYVHANSDYLARITPADPTSYKGQVDVATVMAQLVAHASETTNPGLTFINNGVDVQLQGIYLVGSDSEKMMALKRAAGIEHYWNNNVVTICPGGVALTTPVVPVVSAQTGLRGYPTSDGQGVTFRTLFNPAIEQGKPVLIVSPDVPKAEGTWKVISVNHNLESETLGGAWFSTVRGWTLGN